MNKKTKLIIIIGAIIVALLILSVFIVQGCQNKAIDYEERIMSAQSDINVQEKRRGDLIPNLVDCVKEYDKHEYETLMAVISARQEGITDEDAAWLATPEALKYIENGQLYAKCSAMEIEPDTGRMRHPRLLELRTDL